MNDHAAALDLMQQALNLLDRVREYDAAARLQHAIDYLTGEKPMRPGEILPDERMQH